VAQGLRLLSANGNITPSKQSIEVRHKDFTLLGLDEAKLKLGDLRQAIDYERQYQFIDVQGRKSPFSAFITRTLKQLGQSQLTLDPAVDSQIKKLETQFNQYRFMDMGRRMHWVDALEAFMIQTLTPLLKSLQGGRLSPTIKSGQTTAATNENPPTSALGQPVQFVKGVGPKLAQLLGQLGIITVQDLIYHFPRKYLDYQHRLSIAQLQPDSDVTVIGTITSVSAYNAKHKPLSILTVVVSDNTGRVQASWFLGKASQARLEQLKKQYLKGSTVMLSGRTKWDSYKRVFTIDRPEVETLSYEDDEPDSIHAGRIVPVYTLCEGIGLRQFRRIMFHVLGEVAEDIHDPFPTALKTPYQLDDLAAALHHIHFPETTTHYETARKRLVFDELFYLQARLALLRANYKQSVQGLSLTPKPGGYVDQFLATLPFQLTNAQQRVFEEIKGDMAASEPMYRLLQGDVGSGKTVIALLTLLVAVENGYQGALMAPTEILAEQHYQRFVAGLTPLGLKVGLFVGKANAKQRREMKQGLLNGQIHIAVGTHALIQHEVEFQRLGAVVVDEQHRFGVRQRMLLKEKGDHPEMLTMTATPIPRTLAMTIHGDLDVSLLDELPPGRTPIITSLTTTKQIKKAYELITAQIAQGRQAYIVLPLVEDSETLAAKAATTEAERLQKEVFPALKVGLLHGKMKPEEKDAAMTAFAHGHIHILVSTTVVEVGVDVPNATVMVIENAERFGLSQLHQLRGRVGRGQHQSYCVLVSESRTEETLNRLGIMTETEDGFVIAEKDLQLRGPGEFLGTRQSGLPDFMLADLVSDRAILEQARQAAFKVVNEPRYFADYPELKQAILNQAHKNATGVLGSG